MLWEDETIVSITHMEFDRNIKPAYTRLIHKLDKTNQISNNQVSSNISNVIN